MHHLITSCAALLGALALIVSLTACGDTDNAASSCDPNTTTNCVCTDDTTGAVCDPDTSDTACTCAVFEPTTNNNTITGGECLSLEGSDTLNPLCSPLYWRFVLIEDLTENVSGEYPGADIDAIELTDATGTSYFATTVEDLNLGGGSALDTTQALGAPDSNCDADSGAFVSLGGVDAGGYVMVGFSTNDRDVSFTTGSSITVHELGGTMCGQFDDDPYQVSVSVSTDRTSFTQIGTATGMTAIPVAQEP